MNTPKSPDPRSTGPADAENASALAADVPETAARTNDGRIRSGRLAGLTMWSAIFVLAWPILAESLLSSLVGLTDTYLSAQVSVAATDAIGGASYVMWFVGLIAMALGIGATAIISRAVGAGRMATANAATGQTLLLGLVGGTIVGVFVALIAPALGSMLGMSDAAHEAFVTFMRIICVGAPGITMMGAALACARGSGDSLRPLISMVAVNIVNMVVSFALSGVDLSRTLIVNGEQVTRVVLNNQFGLDMGVAGIAWGTVIGDYVGLAVILWMLSAGWTGVRLKLKRLVPHRAMMARLIRVGIPSFLETLGMWVGNFLVIMIVGHLAKSGAAGASEAGEGILGSHIVAIRIESFSYLPGFAMGTAAATLVGQYLGAGSPRLAKKAVNRCLKMTVIAMGLFGAMLCIFPTTITGLVTTQPEHMAIVPNLLFITGLVQVPFGVSIILRSALRGAGDVKPVLMITWACTYGVRLPLVYLLSGVTITMPGWLGGGVIAHPLFDRASLSMLWVALCVEIVVRGAAFFWRFRDEGWMRVRV